MDPTTQSFMMTHAVVRDVVATVLTISGSLLWVKLFDELARREILEAKLSRKLVHVTSGTFFCNDVVFIRRPVVFEGVRDSGAEFTGV